MVKRSRRYGKGHGTSAIIAKSPGIEQGATLTQLLQFEPAETYEDINAED